MNLRDRLNDNIKNHDFTHQDPKTLTAEDLAQDLDMLNTKLDAITREVSAWDLYNIKDVVSNPADTIKKIGALAPGTGLVVNVSGGDYGQGDVILKRSDGEIIIIRGDTGAALIPVKIENNKIIYNYASEAPDSIPLDIPQGLRTTPVMYNKVYTTHSFTLQLFRDSYNRPIIPVVKCYTSYGEEVECALTTTINNSNAQMTVTDIPDIVARTVVR